MTGAEPIWIEQAVILAVHDRLLVLHGGAAGLRDKGLLESALARPRQSASYGSGVDVIDLAGAYTAGIVTNHPFIDGNKRTGFVAGILFLELNGYSSTAPEDAAAEAVLRLAAGERDERGYTDFLRNNVTALAAIAYTPEAKA